ncbi:hypothetical protein DSAG12_00981 [Promethearchaeum syntrophicum]|uniref:Uncharacterized protein n=1 Tax=Promethearchaeum syntrophicum TaxID=2594042 RepID=A0A5B9D8F2_9ARCH|nr:hypothetical protein [Candidatus Prometheoarchaeum syntrophicum]QEE15157.1 hypothetical protein DSAG12_00981 [Candidatus Prometheoarchaeum syntrophicum]
MSTIDNFEFNQNTNIFLKFIIDLLLYPSDFIFDIIICKSDKIIIKSIGKDVDILYDLVEKWQNYDFPATFTIQDKKFIKLHVSPFNLIFRSIQGKSALIGLKFQYDANEMQLFAIIKHSSKIQLIATAMKDMITSILNIGQKMSDIIVVDAQNLEIRLNFAENKQDVSSFIKSLKNLDFLCNYTDRGDSMRFNFKYEKKKEKIYPAYMYK